MVDYDIFTTYELPSTHDQELYVLFPENVYVGTILLHTDETKTTSGVIKIFARTYDFDNSVSG